MADKAISELIAANQVTPTDLFVLEQSGTAKKLTGQILENWLLELADGHGGIQSVEKKSTSGLVDTYRITLADTTTFDFMVTNGKAVDSISKTKTSGLVDTYTIQYNDNTKTTFTVTNGAKGDKGDNQYVWIKYASKEPTSTSHSFGDVPDNWIGIYSGDAFAAPTDWTQYKWFEIKGEKGETGDPATVVSNAVEYQVSDSGTIIPSGAWGSSIPVVAQGKYMWTRTTTTFNSGSSAVSYSVSRMGMDGSGSVTSVANISPDENGNVPLTAEHIGALSNTGGDMTGELKMNGQPISGLNQPAADDQVANKLYVDQQTKKAAPRNLLDNSDFRNPVNQRGEASYTGSVYGIDRWKGNSGSTKVTLTEGGIQISSTSTSGTQPIMQRILIHPGNTGKKVTFAVKVKVNAGQVRPYFIGNPSFADLPEGWNILVNTFTIPSDAESFYVGLQARNSPKILCEWMALYEGEYTVETLPEYQPKGYGTELAECQRYYQIVDSGYGAVRSSGSMVTVFLPLSVPMRSADVSVVQININSIRSNGAVKNPTDCTAVLSSNRNSKYDTKTSTVVLDVSGTFELDPHYLAIVDGVFHLSAEDL